MAYNYYPYLSGSQMLAPNYTQPVPTYPQQPQAQSVGNNFIWVQGEAAAKSYPVAAGNSVILMDSENSVMYVKSSDNTGKPMPMQIYDLVRREETTNVQTQPQIDLSEYVKRNDLQALIEQEVKAAVDKALA